MPLSNEHGAVTSCPKQRWERHLSVRQTTKAVFFLPSVEAEMLTGVVRRRSRPRRICVQPRSDREPSGVERGARWRADRRGGEPLGEEHAAASERVNIRRAKRRVAIDAEVERPKIISHDDCDVGRWCRRRGDCGGAVQQKELGLKDECHHD